MDSDHDDLTEWGHRVIIDVTPDSTLSCDGGLRWARSPGGADPR